MGPPSRTEGAGEMAQPYYRAHVLTCAGSGCTASGSAPVMTALDAEVRRQGLEGEVRLVQTGCRGFCSMGPVMMIYPEGIFYCQVQPEDVPWIVKETLVKGRPVQNLSLIHISEPTRRTPISYA